MKRFISFILIFTSTAFGADGWSGPMRNEIARYQPPESSHGPAMDFAPAQSGLNFEVGFTNFHAPLSHNGQSAEFSAELAKANDLFHAGDKQGLQKLHGELTSFSFKSLFNAREYRMQAKYVDSLINSKYLESFQRLNQAPASEVKQVLREIVAMNPDPVTKAEAMIAADKMVGDIFCDYGAEFKLDTTGHEATDMMVTTRVGSYQIEKLMPAKGVVPDKAMTQEFVEGVMRITERMPQELQDGFLQGAIQGFVEAVVDPGRITQENITIAKEVSITLFDSLIGYRLRSEQYGQQRTEQIDRYAKSIHGAFKNYNSKQWGHLAGESAVRTLHCYGWFKAGQFVAGRVSAAAEVAASAPLKMEEVLSQSVKESGTNNWHNQMIKAEDIIKQFDAMRLENVQSRPHPYAELKTGVDPKTGITVTVRTASKSGPATIDFKVPKPNNVNGHKIIKVRYGK